MLHKKTFGEKAGLCTCILDMQLLAAQDALKSQDMQLFSDYEDTISKNPLLLPDLSVEHSSCSIYS